MSEKRPSGEGSETSMKRAERAAPESGVTGRSVHRRQEKSPKLLSKVHCEAIKISSGCRVARTMPVSGRQHTTRCHSMQTKTS